MIPSSVLVLYFALAVQASVPIVLWHGMGMTVGAQNTPWYSSNLIAKPIFFQEIAVALLVAWVK